MIIIDNILPLGIHYRWPDENPFMGRFGGLCRCCPIHDCELEVMDDLPNMIWAYMYKWLDDNE